MLTFSLALLSAGTLFAQQRPITGVVTDASGPMSGVAVTVQGTSKGTVTVTDGKYSISAATGDVLQFSFMGYTDATVTVGAQNVINVTLQEDATDLDEIVVIGYGAVRKRDLTGSVQSLKNEEITLAPTGNVMEALQGRVAGLDIVRSSGKAGADVEMNLRGTRSINGKNEPLFIIDGVEGKYSELNPNDIESIEILKDASSTAIYGSAGANGVVMITTKSGKKGKVTVNFDAYYGVNGMLQFPAVRMGDDYIEHRRQANRGTHERSNGFDGSWDASAPNSKYFTDAEWNAIQGGRWVDWFDLGTRNGILQNYSVSMSGGNENTSAYFSVGYHNEEGILKNDDNTRYSIRANVEHKVNNWFKGGLNVNSAFTDRNERRGQYFTRVLSLLPLGTPYDEDGNINPFPLAGDSQLSPIADMIPNQYYNNRKMLGINPTAFLEFTPLSGLSIKTVGSAYLNFSRQGVYRGKNSSEGYSLGRSFATLTNRNQYDYKWENIVNYSFMVADEHSFVVTGVTSWSKKQREESAMTGYDLGWDKYLFHNMGATDAASRTTSSDYKGSQVMSYIARLNYSFQGKYLLTVSNRWDGSSMLADGYRWDSFPAAAIAWRISDEAFMENMKNVDNLKLRLGYGVTGNAGAEEYATLNFGSAGTNLAWQDNGIRYFIPSANMANKALAWEKSYGWNIGVDLNMFRNRLNLTVDAYRQETKDILYKRSMPSSLGGHKTSGYTMWQNICETLNQGIEVVLNSVNVRNSEFSWSTTLTFATNRERLTSFVGSDPVVGANGTYLMEGHPLRSIYDYKYLGIWQISEAAEAAKYGLLPGDVKIEDVDESGTYTTADRQILGAPVPKWTAGLSNVFTYKNFDLTVFLDARWGQLMNHGILGWYNPGGGGNGPAIIDYWTPENTNGRFPQPREGVSFAQLPLGASSTTIIDGSYFKVRNITLGYTLPANLLKKAGLSNARIYTTLSNPFIYTKSEYLKNYDPERGGADEFPLARQVVFGVNISF